MLPCDQQVLVFEEQGLCDDVFMASQPVQPTLIDDVPHDHICVLTGEEKVINVINKPGNEAAHKPEQRPRKTRLTLEPVTSRAPSLS